MKWIVVAENTPGELLEKEVATIERADMASPIIELEDSLTAFVKRTLRLDVGGRTIRSVKEQLNRLAAADFRFYVKHERGAR